MSEEENQAIINQYKILRQQVQTIAAKIQELESEQNEHMLVLRTIKDLDPNRRCYRSIGGVLVERTLAEVVPAVQKNLSGIQEVMTKLAEQLRNKEKETDAFRVQYNIGMTGNEEQQNGAPSESKREGGTGVLA